LAQLGDSQPPRVHFSDLTVAASGGKYDAHE